jgi:hypothetical protein
MKLNSSQKYPIRKKNDYLGNLEEIANYCTRNYRYKFAFNAFICPRVNTIALEK